MLIGVAMGLSQIWGQNIFARKYMHEKLTKCPNFIHDNCQKNVFPNFYVWGVGSLGEASALPASPVFYAY